MMKFDVVPNKSVGNVIMGMDRDSVRKKLAGFKKEFKKTLFSRRATDDFGYCHVFYNSEDKCNAIEFWGNVKLVYKNTNLFDLKKEELPEYFSDIKEDYGSYISRKYSIGISYDGNKIESILIGCKGYYC